MGTASALYTFILEDFCTHCGLKALFRFAVFEQIVLDLLYQLASLLHSILLYVR